MDKKIALDSPIAFMTLATYILHWMMGCSWASILCFHIQCGFCGLDLSAHACAEKQFTEELLCPAPVFFLIKREIKCTRKGPDNQFGETVEMDVITLKLCYVAPEAAYLC